MEKDLEAIPKKLRRVIKYISDNPDDVAISTSRDLAKKLDVNPATIVRASKELGYKGYYELKQDKKNTFRKKNNPYEIILESLKDESSNGDLIKKSMLKNIDMLNDTVANISVKDIETVSKLIHDSDRTYIIGLLPASRAIAGFMGGELRTYHPGVLEIMTVNIFLFDFIRHCKPGDVVIGISFGDGLDRITGESLKKAQENGATTVVITDSTVSPLLKCADYKLMTALTGEFVYASTIGAFNIAIAIIHCFIKLGGEEYKEKLDETRKLMAEKNIWY